MTGLLNTLIIDDERPARMRIKELIAPHRHFINLVGEADNGAKAIEQINALQPDLIFLDINMPDLDGFSVLTKVVHQPMIVFTTAYEQFAVKAFEENAIDYLLKPIEEERFTKCITRLKALEQAQPPLDVFRLKQLFDGLRPRKEITAIPIKIKDKILLVRLSRIAYFQAAEGYVIIHQEDGTQHISDLNLVQLEEKLPATFLRVQKSYIVNTEKVKEISKYFNNRLILTMQDMPQSRITTGTSYISQIRDFFNL